MGHYLENFHEIFFLKYRPWLINYSDLEFQQELNQLEDVPHFEAPIYEVDFPKPLNIKRKFYKKLIDDDCIRFLNQLGRDVQDTTSEPEKTYYVYHALSNIIISKLWDVAEIIELMEYHPSQYDLQGVTTSCYHPDGNDSYILHFLKHQLVRLYLEVQQRYPLLIDRETFTEDEVYRKYFYHCTPGHIRANNFISDDHQLTDHTQEETTKAFLPCTSDLYPQKPGIRSYSELIKNPQKFADLEQEFFKSGYISSNYQFTKKRGGKTEFAMILIYVKKKEYFNNKIFPGNKVISMLEIRKFFEHRYGVSLERVMRNANADPAAIDAFVKKHYWLDNLPS